MNQSITRSSILGLPVICAKSANRIGNVSDILFVPGKEKLDSFVISQSSMHFRDMVLIPEKVTAIGSYAIIAADLNLPELSSFNSRHNQQSTVYGADFINLPVLQDAGNQLGKITDIVFEPTSWKIIGFEISVSLVDDLVDGRNLLPYNSSYIMNETMVLIPSQDAQYMRSYERGIKNILQSK